MRKPKIRELKEQIKNLNIELNEYTKKRNNIQEIYFTMSCRKL